MWVPSEKPFEIIEDRNDGTWNWDPFPAIGGVQPFITREPLVECPNQGEIVLEMFGMEGPSARNTWADSEFYGLWSYAEKIPGYDRITYWAQPGTIAVPVLTANLTLRSSIFAYTMDWAGDGKYLVRLRGRVITRRDFEDARQPMPRFADRLYSLVRGGNAR